MTYVKNFAPSLYIRTIIFSPMNEEISIRRGRHVLRIIQSLCKNVKFSSIRFAGIAKSSSPSIKPAAAQRRKFSWAPCNEAARTRRDAAPCAASARCSTCSVPRRGRSQSDARRSDRNGPGRPAWWPCTSCRSSGSGAAAPAYPGSTSALWTGGSSVCWCGSSRAAWWNGQSLVV